MVPKTQSTRKGESPMTESSFNLRFVFLLGAASLIATGCNAVVSVVPVGQQPAVVNPDEWEGVWYHPQGTITIAVADPYQGILEVGAVGKDPNLAGRLGLKTIRVLVRSSDKWLFFSFRGDNPAEPHYLWGRVQIDMEGKRILAWFPRPERFAQLVREGLLPGKVDEKGNVTLSELQEEHLQLITQEQKGVLFAWENPLVLFKLSRVE
jgi:hypothetical protein